MNKLIAWLKSWLKKQVPPIPIPTPEPIKPTGCGCDLSLPLCDPNPSKYTEQYMAANCSSEECGIEARLQIIARFMVWRGNYRAWWMISSLAMDQVKRNANGTPAIKCFSKDGYRYHIRGYCVSEPQERDVNPTVRSEPAKYILCECRKEIK